MTDLMIIIGLTVGSIVAVGLAGVGLLRLVRYRSLRWQLLVVALTPVVAVAVAVAVNVRLMFLSGHDSGVIAVALATAVLLAVLSAGLLLQHIARGSKQLGSRVSLLVAEETGAKVEDSHLDQPLPLELEQIRRELVEARATLAESRARERNAERARQELVNFLSHDLRTPLAGLRALTEGLEDGVIADVPRALSQLRSTVARMTGLVEDLFDLSRSHQLPTESTRRPVSITELVGDVAEQQTPGARAAGVSLQIAVPADDPLAVNGDVYALGRAFSNLLVNAVRHTEPDGTVKIIARRAEDGHIQVSVLDGCGGIPEAHLPRVFDTGWRGTTSRSEDRSGQPAGAGLGLTITERVVSAHDGSIDVRNVDGGCCFELVLPAPQA